MPRPTPTSPIAANASPVAKRRTSPKRHARSMSVASSSGRIWSRRVSTIEGRGTLMLVPSQTHGQAANLPVFAAVRLPGPDLRPDGRKTLITEHDPAMVPPADGPAGHRQSDGAMRRSQVVRQRILMPLYERLKANLFASAKLAV